MVHRVQVREISNDEGNRLLRIVRRSVGVGGDLAAGADGAAVGPGHGCREIAKVTFTSADRVRDVIHNFNADGFDSLLPALRRRAPADVHAAAAAGDQEDRAGPPDRSRPAVLDLEPGQAGRVPGRRGGGRRHQPRGPARPAPRGGRLLSSHQDLEAVQRPGLRGQEEPGAGALRASPTATPTPGPATRRW